LEIEKDELEVGIINITEENWIGDDLNSITEMRNKI
jgi:hypothetical protein